MNILQQKISFFLPTYFDITPTNIYSMIHIMNVI